MRWMILISLFFLFALSVYASECDDGIDNDGDGLIDWQLDLGCYGPEDATESALARPLENNWTTYDPASNTRIYYVSDSLGNDSWSGLAPLWNGTDGPVKSVAAGQSMIRQHSSDWLLFMRGDTWKDQPLGTWNYYNGNSTDYPIIIASYGNSTLRPRFNSSTTWLNINSNTTNLSILGLHAYLYTRDPNNKYFKGNRFHVFSWLAKGGNFLMEDCKMEFGQVDVQDYQGESILNFTFRRNIFAKSYYSQGLFTRTSAPLKLEENLFYHGGWNDDFRLGLWSPNPNVSRWKEVSAGAINITIYNVTVVVEGLDFSVASDMFDVAEIINSGINSALLDGTVTFNWTLGEAFIMKSSDYPSDKHYVINQYIGAGDDISQPDLLGARDGSTLKYQICPGSTIFARNRYLSGGRGNTTLIRNIDADGASGGVQIREGGLVEDELHMRNPISIVFGSSQNSNFNISGEIKNNVILGNRNIDQQDIGRGIFLESNLESGSFGPSFTKGVNVTGNIVAHATDSTNNIHGISIVGNGPHYGVLVKNNIVYNWTRRYWPNPTDHRASCMVLYINSSSDPVYIEGNILQQPRSGYLISASEAIPGAVRLRNNRYFTNETDSDSIWSKGWFAMPHAVTISTWMTQMNETNMSTKKVNFVDHTRDINSYMASLGKTPDYDTFILYAMNQSRFNWNKSYTADAVNDYIREGFTVDTSIHDADTDADGCIGLAEMKDYIRAWKHRADISINSLRVAFGLWKRKRGCS